MAISEKTNKAVAKPEDTQHSKSRSLDHGSGNRKNKRKGHLLKGLLKKKQRIIVSHKV